MLFRSNLKNVVESNIIDIKVELDNKLDTVAEVIDENLGYFNQRLQESSSEVKKTTDTYNKLSKIVESRISKENEKLEEYSETIKSLYESFLDLQNTLQEETTSQVQIIDEKFESISSKVEDKFVVLEGEVKGTVNILGEELSNFKEKISSEVSTVKTDVVIQEQHLKKVETYIKENHQELINLGIGR